jgi:hypothetical protein
MVHNFSNSLSLSLILPQNPQYQIPCLMRDVLLKADIGLIYRLHHLTGRPPRIRRPFMKHFIQQNSLRPNIDIKILRLPSQNLGTHVLQSPTESDPVLVGQILGAPAKITKFHIDLIIL